MNKIDVAKKYLELLESGNVEGVIGLFNENGIVESPIYGIKKAVDFYRDLKNDTSNSELHLNRIFEQIDSDNLAIHFTYGWTLKNNQKVEFEVVDIIDFDSQNKIKNLKIIYDTVNSRRLVDELNE